jgi:hypothetical protein
VKRRAVVVFLMVVVALIAAGCVSSAPESASHTIAPEPTSNTIKTDGLYRAKTDAPICETHDELVTAAYEYDGGHTPDVSGCTALAKGEEVKSWLQKLPTISTRFRSTRRAISAGRSLTTSTSRQ